MSSTSSGSDSSSDGSNVTRFTLDGVVAEMVVEVDEDQEQLLSPNRALKLNGLDNYEQLKASALRHSYVALDRIGNMDNIKVSTEENPEQKDSILKQNETDAPPKKFQEVKIPFQSNDLNTQVAYKNEESDLSLEKEIDVSDEERKNAAETLQNDLSKIDRDESVEVTGTNKGDLSEAEEAVQVKAQLSEVDENNLAFEDATKTNEVLSSKCTENEPSLEDDASKMKKVQLLKNESNSNHVTKTNEVQALEQNKEIQPLENKPNFEHAIKTWEASDCNESETAFGDASKTNKVQSLEKNKNKSTFEGATATNKAANEITKTGDIQPLKKNEKESVVEKFSETSEAESSVEDKNKSALDRMTETIVVGCESTGLELKDTSELPASKRYSKLPIKKRKLKEPVSTDDDERKRKKEVSAPVPVKKAKIVKVEDSKKGIKRPTEDKSEGAGKRLRSRTKDSSGMQRRSQMSGSAKKPEVRSKNLEVKAKKPEVRNKNLEVRAKKPELQGKKPEEKTKKSEIKNKTPEIKNKKPEVKNKKPEIKNKKPEVKNKKPEIKNKKLEIKQKPDIKRQSLRKTTLQKSLVLSKPKVYNLNPGKVTNLGVFSEIKERMHQSDMKYLRYLYRILYDQWPPKDINALKEELLNFEGFNFKKKSQDLQKREQVLKKMPDMSIAEMCKILDLRVDTKENMISEIIKFLLKPVKIIISSVDPFDPSMQPSVKLERISLDEYLNKTIKKEQGTPVPVKRSKRERYPSIKLEIYVSDVLEKTPLSTTKNEKKNSQHDFKTESGFKGESSKNIAVKKNTANKLKSKVLHKDSLKVNKESMATKFLKRKKKLKLSRKKNSNAQKARQKLMKLALKIQTTKSPVKSNSDEESFDRIISKSEIKLEPFIEDVRDTGKESELNEIEERGVTKANENLLQKDSSTDSTISSDEAKQITKADSPKKRVSHKRVGKPLRYFTKVKENILNANFSALQRLHILLFGASDKADNLKGNILAFGGFPFLEGSEEWKQKEFLLSLLAQNTLREYLNLLCIEYSDDDQKLLIRKLMKFLAAPSDKSLDDEIRTQVISSEPVSHAPVHATKAQIPRKKTKKALEKKKSRARKVLMDEVQVKRLEADLAREQRILERERRLHREQAKKSQTKPSVEAEKPVLESSKNIHSFVIKDGMESNESLEQKAALTGKQSDAELLNALLQTVYKRRALKKAGVVISAPKKESLTRLGELANVKFLVVTANYSDLDVLHHLIYMTEANKAKVRKNILDFAGFNFAEDSNAYKDRMAFLNSLGYDISKRIAFLLGLCPFKTEIEQQDLNELIMYFLMHPCKSKQIPIRHLPQTFFRKDIPKEICQLIKKHLVDLTVAPVSVTENQNKKQPDISILEDKASTSTPFRQKAKKSFKSSCLPPAQRKGLSPSISTLSLSAPKPLVKPLKPFQPVLLPGQTNKIFLPALGQSPQITLQKTVLKAPPSTITIPSTPNAPQEVLIQQHTPDGQQKTFKLIKFPASQSVHSDAHSVLKTPSQQHPLNLPAPIAPVVQSKPITFTQPVQVNPILSAPLPPGLLFFKGSPTLGINQALPNLVQTVPVVLNPPSMDANPLVTISNTTNPENIVITEEEKSDVPVVCEYGEDTVEELNPLADSNPPTDEDLFNSIQEVIHSSDFENITLKNVIDRVAAQYSTFDLTHRHMYMKECIKKIIMGT